MRPAHGHEDQRIRRRRKVRPDDIIAKHECGHARVYRELRDATIHTRLRTTITVAKPTVIVAHD
jgi:hypothetical protein